MNPCETTVQKKRIASLRSQDPSITFPSRVKDYSKFSGLHVIESKRSPHHATQSDRRYDENQSEGQGIRSNPRFLNVSMPILNAVEGFVEKISDNTAIGH